MKFTTVLTISLLLAFMTAAFANEISLDTPEGSFNLRITGDNYYEAGRTNSGTIIDNIGMKLEEIEKEHVSKLPRLDRTRAENIISEIFAMLVLLPTDADIRIEQTTPQTQQTGSASININMSFSDQGMQAQQPQKIEPEKTPATPTKVAMSDSDFQRFLGNVRAESFSDDQLRVIRLGSRDAWFSVSQIGRMIDVLSFSEDKLEALDIMYPRVTDPQNAHNILNHFTFSSDKQDAERIISK